MYEKITTIFFTWGPPYPKKCQLNNALIKSKIFKVNEVEFFSQFLFEVVFFFCTNQQPPQRGGTVPDPVWVGSKWLLDFPRIPVTPGTPLHFFAMLLPERPQKGSTQLSSNRSPVFSFFFLPPLFVSSFFSFS